MREQVTLLRSGNPAAGIAEQLEVEPCQGQRHNLVCAQPPLRTAGKAMMAPMGNSVSGLVGSVRPRAKALICRMLDLAQHRRRGYPVKSTRYPDMIHTAANPTLILQAPAMTSAAW